MLKGRAKQVFFSVFQTSFLNPNQTLASSVVLFLSPMLLGKIGKAFSQKYFQIYNSARYSVFCPIFLHRELCASRQNITCAKTLFISYVFVFFCLGQTSRRQLVREIGNGLSAEMSFFYKNLTHHLKYICCKCTTNTRCSLYSFKYETYEPKNVL